MHDTSTYGHNDCFHLKRVGRLERARHHERRTEDSATVADTRAFRIKKKKKRVLIIIIIIISVEKKTRHVFRSKPWSVNTPRRVILLYYHVACVPDISTPRSNFRIGRVYVKPRTDDFPPTARPPVRPLTATRSAVTRARYYRAADDRHYRALKYIITTSTSATSRKRI